MTEARREWPESPRVDLVVPTSGRASLRALLDALAAGSDSLPGKIFLVDDRCAPDVPLLPEGLPEHLADRVEMLEGKAAGPAAARNVGWRASGAEWVAFLDDDVVPDGDWCERLAGDLAGLGPEVAGSQGEVRVPLPKDRRPTDWERNVKGLEGARWITANIAYRRRVLEEVGGFDERFPRAYREDADLGLRTTSAGYRIMRGRRSVEHPVRPAGPFVSVRLQAGNADDAIMRALHGPGWRERAGVPAGRRTLHLATTVAGVSALAALVFGRRKLRLMASMCWLAGTAEFAWRRVAPGPRTPAEVATMLATSVLIPPVAAGYWLAGLLRSRRVLGQSPRKPSLPKSNGRPEAVLLDRDGTLVFDVPYNGDPEKVAPIPSAREALSRLREVGIPLAVVSNQSGVARGWISPEQVSAVNHRVEELLGPLGPWAVCPHGPEEGCDCRKPAPGLVYEAAFELGVEPSRCAVIGDIGADVEAARAAGARGVLVPTEKTRPEEVEAAPEVAGDLGEAVDLLLGGER